MDVLKDITDGLRETGQNRRSGYEQGPDHEQEGDTERSNSGTSAFESLDDADDEHLCAFCQTAFDAERGYCPDCGAEIVLRGRR